MCVSWAITMQVAVEPRRPTTPLYWVRIVTSARLNHDINIALTALGTLLHGALAAFLGKLHISSQLATTAPDRFAKDANTKSPLCARIYSICCFYNGLHYTTHMHTIHIYRAKCS